MQTPSPQPTRFIDYAAQREKGATSAQLAATFPQAASFERIYQYNLGARQADDVFSPSGERGTAFDRQEVPTYTERLYGSR